MTCKFKAFDCNLLVKRYCLLSVKQQGGQVLVFAGTRGVSFKRNLIFASFVKFILTKSPVSYERALRTCGLNSIL